MFKGGVAGSGFGHFRECRPKFYEAVLALSGMALHCGSINLKIYREMPRFPLPNTQRIPGQEQIELDHNRDIPVTPCLMEGQPGFWILPMFKGTNLPNPNVNLPGGVIEVSLLGKLPQIILEGFR